MKSKVIGVLSLAVFLIVALVSINIACAPKVPYTGIVESINSWDGSALVLTKSKTTNKIMTVRVARSRFDLFVVGQKINFYINKCECNTNKY